MENIRFRNEKKTLKHKNIPIFIPHMGCPNQCVFCNQRSISGKESFCRESVENEIEEALATISPDSEVEIAYFGGSFTGIDRKLMIYLLEVAKSFVDNRKKGRARVSGIRMSTRPDYINSEIMGILSKYPVKTVELGLQSMDNEVLRLSKRGHTSLEAEAACKMIKAAGYTLVGQMMIGLPGSDLAKELMTAKKICDLGADGARIYPTVTFYDTELADMADRGEYKMLELSDAVERSKEVLKIFRSRGVECIRIGLCASDNLGDLEKVKGGANHPALGELVRGEIYYDSLRSLFANLARSGGTRGKSFSVFVERGELSLAIGQNRRNKERIMREFGIKELKFGETECSVGITVYEVE